MAKLLNFISLKLTRIKKIILRQIFKLEINDLKDRRDLINKYLYLTREVLPSLARSKRTTWPVRNDHCFQRIVLDNLCGGVWYNYLDRPAYKHLTNEQAKRAIDLCCSIEDGRADIHALNNQSLIWRGKRPRSLEVKFPIKA